MKRILSLIAAVSILALLSYSCKCSSGDKGEKTQDEVTDTVTVADSIQTEDNMTDIFANLPEEPIFIIKTNLGDITVQLYSKTPKHRDNFIKLAKEHFYDGILFHRVINGFMIQAGDPLTKDPAQAEMYGTGGPGYTVPAEFVNEYYHKKGALAAARRGDAANPRKASSGSQFYLVQDEMNCLQLDGEYTIFGETLQGLEVIDAIAAVATDRRDRPVNDVKILSVLPAPKIQINLTPVQE